MALIIWSMNAGGSERVMALLANEWAVRSARVSLLALTEEHKSHFPLHSSIIFACLGLAPGASQKPGKITTFAERLAAPRCSLQRTQPDVIVSFTARVNTLTVLSSFRMPVPVIISERVDPSMWLDTQPWQFLRSCTNRLANAVVSPTESVASVLRKMAGRRSLTIPNPVPEREPFERSCTSRRLVGCGHPIEGRGFACLIESFYLLHQRYPDRSLTIAGEAEMLMKLEQLLIERGLSDRVHLPGAYNNPSEVLADAVIFVLSSRYEGFPHCANRSYGSRRSRSTFQLQVGTVGNRPRRCEWFPCSRW